ncbi:MAG: hypothetical protein Kow0037_11560 [Calditrichia bacterium]
MLNRKLIILVFLLSSLLPVLVPAQEFHFTFKTFNVSEGLSQSSASSIVQDPFGFIWIGTHDGLNRFDGYNFEIYRSLPDSTNCLSNNEIFSLFLDTTETTANLWVANNSNGVDCLNLVSGKFSHIAFRKTSNNSGSIIPRQILKDPQGYLWVATSNYGICIYDSTSGEIISLAEHLPAFQKLKGKSIPAMVLADNRKIFLGSNDGYLYEIEYQQSPFVDAKISEYKIPSPGKSSFQTNLRQLYKDLAGNIWIIGMDAELQFFIPKLKRFFPFHIPIAKPETKFTTMMIGRDRSLWIGTWGNGYYYYNPILNNWLNVVGSEAKSQSLSGNTVLEFFEDKNKDIWIGTAEGGVSLLTQYHRQPQKIATIRREVDKAPNTLTGNYIMSIYPESDGFWVGNIREGLSYFHTKNERFYHILKSEDGKPVKSIYNILKLNQSSKSIYWLASYGQGIFRFDLPQLPPASNLKVKPVYFNGTKTPTNVLHLFQDSRGNIWCGTFRQGVYYIPKEEVLSPRPSAKTLEEISGWDSTVYDRVVRRIVEDPDGNIWMGDWEHGLLKFTPDSHRLENIPIIPDGLEKSLSAANQVSSIYFDRRKWMWMSTYGAGLLLKLPDREKFYVYTTKNGLSSMMLYGIVEDDYGQIWVSSNRGLNIIKVNDSTTSPPSLSISVMDANLGLQSQEFNTGAAARDEEGRLYFGGVNGMNIIHPEPALLDTTSSPLRITRIQIDGVPLAADTAAYLKRHLILPPGTAYLNIEFALLDFINPSQNRFEYQLQPVNNSWVPLGTKNSLVLTNLAPGNYQLNLRGRNFLDLPSSNQLQLWVTVQPNFWQTGWFRLLSLLFLFSAIFVGHRLYVRNIKEKNAILRDINSQLNRHIQERNAALKNLEISEDRFRSIVENSQEGIVIIDDQYRIEYANREFLNLVKGDEEYVVGQDFRKHLTPKSMDLVTKRYRDRQAGKPVPSRYEFELKCRDGQIKLVELSSTTFKNIDGAPRTLSQLLDITQRKRAEILQQVLFNIAWAIHTSKDILGLYRVIQTQLGRLIDTQNFFIAFFNQEKNTLDIQYMSDEKDQFSSLPLEGTISALVLRQNRSLLLGENEIHEMAEKGKISLIGTPSKQWMGVPIREKGKPFGLMVVQSYAKTDAFSESDLHVLELITDQVGFAIQRKLVEAEISRLSLAIEQSPTGVAITDLERTLIYTNGRFRELFSHLEPKTGIRIDELFKIDIGDEERNRIWNLVSGGKTWRGEIQLKSSQKESPWILLHISPILGEKRQTLQYLFIVEDISETKKLQHQLNQAQKMESIGTLAGGIAHDFNNILTIINGHAELSMLKIGKSNPIYKDLESILNAGRRAENLARQLLAFSRKQMYQPRVLDINQVIGSFDKMLRRLIGESIKMETILRADIKPVKADPHQIEQILMNLVVNARDALEDSWEDVKSPSIIVETDMTVLEERLLPEHPGAKSGEYVVISVSDNGKGMDEETISKIFDPFFTTKGPGKGTGLGLSTVYGIVKQNEGNIYVYSEPGKGTTFKIYWPVAETDQPQKVSGTPEQTIPRGFGRILLVEDEEAVRSLAEEALISLGYTVFTAANGLEAITILDSLEYRIDLIITDVVMPEMSGKELASHVAEKKPQIPILFTSGYTQNQFGLDGELGTNIQFIQKPFTVPALARTVNNLLSSKN